MSIGLKFMVLATQAYREQRFTEAGVLFAQAAEVDDLPDVLNKLMSDAPEDNPPLTEEAPEGEGVVEATPSTPNTSTSADNEYVSAVMRSAISPSRIARILASSMEATASEEDPDSPDESQDVVENPEVETTDDSSDLDEDLDVTPDPDIPGQPLIPASFSSDEGDDSEDEEEGDSGEDDQASTDSDTSGDGSSVEEEEELDADSDTEESTSQNVTLTQEPIKSPVKLQF